MLFYTLAIRMSTKLDRRETSSIGDLIQAITTSEWIRTEGNRSGCKLDIFQLGATPECAIANSFEVFVADDAFEGGAFGKRHLFDDFQFIGEVDALEGGIALECAWADSFEVFVEDDALEGGPSKYQPFDDFELTGESDTCEGEASLEGRLS